MAFAPGLLRPPIRLVAFHDRRRDSDDELAAEVVCYVSEGVDRERGRFFIRCLLERFPLRFAGFHAGVDRGERTTEFPARR